MQAKFGMSLFISVAWLLVGGMVTFWIGADQVPWRVVGILVTIIGLTGINLAISERNTQSSK